MEVEETNTEPMNNDEMEDKFITRRECLLKEETVNGVKDVVDSMSEDIGDIKASLASIRTWMEMHNQVHNQNPTGWKKAQTYGIIAAIFVSCMSLLSSTALGIIGIILMSNKP